MGIPNQTKRNLLEAYLSGETVRVALLSDSTAYSFNEDSHDFVDDIIGAAADEFSGSGYSRKTLSGGSFQTDDGGDEGVFDGSDIAWSGLDGDTIQGLVVYRQVGGDDSTPGDDEIIAVFDDTDSADLPLVTNGGSIDLEWAAEGIVNLN